MSKVSIIIPVFNQWQYTERCLRSVFANTPSEVFKVRIFDNASSDQTAGGITELKARHPNLSVMHSESNLGFSPACNLAAQGCDTEFLLFLNNDTEVTKGWLDPLLSAFNDRDVGICGPKLVYPDSRRINQAGYVYNYRFGSFYPIYHNEAAVFAPANQQRDYQALLGACLLLPNALFKSVEGFWEHGLEDIDLCLKLRERGKLARYVPASTVYHSGSITLRFSEKGSYPETSNRQFRERWLSGKAVWDDYKWYALDGSRPLPDGQAQSERLSNLELSYKFTTEGITFHRSKDLASAESSLIKALQAWNLNPDALSELMVVQLETSNLQAALQTAGKMIEQVGFSALASIEAAQVIAACGQHQEARAAFLKVLSDSTLNLDLKAYAQSLFSNLFGQPTVG